MVQPTLTDLHIAIFWPHRRVFFEGGPAGRLRFEPCRTIAATATRSDRRTEATTSSPTAAAIGSVKIANAGAAGPLVLPSSAPPKPPRAHVPERATGLLATLIVGYVDEHH